MSGARVLVVDDEPQIRRALRVALGGHGYVVEIAVDGEEALVAIASHVPDVIVLDLMMPGTDGLEVVKQTRQWSNVPIIVLSARGDERDKVTALDLGADDYLTKPFDMMELIARIKALLRRSGSAVQRAKIPALRFRELVLEPDTRRVTIAGDEVELTPTEFKILEIFLQAPGSVFSRDKLIELVMGYEYEGYGRTLDSHIARLRGKIELDIKSPEYIKTVFGVGYKLGD